MKVISLVFILLSVVACTSPATETTTQKNDSTQQAMVVTANPLASQAGARIIQAGGSAVDAAIAIESVLSLVEPQSSGMAGGGFMVYYDNKRGTVSVYDGRERAPKNAKAGRFLLENGKKMGFLQAKHSGLSTGVPGVVSMFQLAHADHGQLPWGEHFADAIRLAKEGFQVSPRLNSLIERFGKYLPKTPEQGSDDAWHYFHTDDGQPLPVGYLLKNPAYANTLQQLAANPDSFYHGKIAKAIVAAVAEKPFPGGLTLDDLAAYKAEVKPALCVPYKSNTLCGPPPPASWLAVAMIAEIYHQTNTGGGQSNQNWHLFAEAQRLAYADRDHFVADPQAVNVPVAGMLNRTYLRTRADLIDSDQALTTVNPGNPWVHTDKTAMIYGDDATNDVAGTTHFVVVDKQGNVVSMTASVESIFGSTRMVGGMFLNNQLTDFSFLPSDENGQAIANAVAGGKRPRSSMSPTIMLDANGQFKLATGSPGGNSIIAYTAKTLIGTLEWGLTPQQAIDLPNLVARGAQLRIEQDRTDQALINDLRARGHQVKESAGEISGLSMVLRHANGQLEGGVDPRREGTIETIN